MRHRHKIGYGWKETTQRGDTYYTFSVKINGQWCILSAFPNIVTDQDKSFDFIVYPSPKRKHDIMRRLRRDEQQESEDLRE